VPRKNSQGELLDINGNVWREGDDPSRLEWVANEGVRISRLVQHIADVKVEDREQRKLLTELLDAKAPEGEMESISKSVNTTSHPTGSESSGKSVTITVPIHVTLSIGTPESSERTLVGAKTDANLQSESLLEKVEPDQDYSNRPGYQPEFLGFNAPFPKLTSAIRSSAYALPRKSGDSRFELKYHWAAAGLVDTTLR
jgi:endonuclease G